MPPPGETPTMISTFRLGFHPVCAMDAEAAQKNINTAMRNTVARDAAYRFSM
jgi:hypothetical protein